MRMANRLGLLGLLATAACHQVKPTAQVGVAQLSVSGTAALAPPGGSLGSTSGQDVESAFGLGDAVTSPWARLQLDFGTPVFSVSGFAFEQSGTGFLSSQFGNLIAGTAVDTDISLQNFKAALAFELPLGQLSLSPGLAVSVLDLQMEIRDQVGLSSEKIDVLAPIPVVFLRGEFDMGFLDAVAEIGYLEVPKIKDIEGTFVDAEFMLQAEISRTFHVFAGYRLLQIDGDGVYDDQEFATDLEVAGWMIGGGIRF